ncbi:MULTISPECIES: hypothetical protein [Pseudomonas]|uniref:hypothetical protein n=1 Tax=Pseudomonas TaxID=286 RepID=UPI000F042921|nr:MULTISPECIES: hypothetical protein [Pseudomonas]MBD8615184.1 hypothetical protein [Pseudomonas putida]MBD8682162.1 hypothetical protein [Pseudomonas sp. CFBP 13719]
MNKIMTYQDMSFADYTPFLADSIQQILSKGMVLEHKEMTVVSSTAGEGFVDPLSNARVMPERTGIYSRDAVGAWRIIGEPHQMDDLAMHLAMKTPLNSRYSLMVDLLEKVASAPVVLQRNSAAAQEGFQPR